MKVNKSIQVESLEELVDVVNKLVGNPKVEEFNFNGHISKERSSFNASWQEEEKF